MSRFFCCESSNLRGGNLRFSKCCYLEGLDCHPKWNFSHTVTSTMDIKLFLSGSWWSSRSPWNSGCSTPGSKNSVFENFNLQTFSPKFLNEQQNKVGMFPLRAVPKCQGQRISKMSQFQMGFHHITLNKTVYCTYSAQKWTVLYMLHEKPY